MCRLRVRSHWWGGVRRWRAEPGLPPRLTLSQVRQLPGPGCARLWNAGDNIGLPGPCERAGEAWCSARRWGSVGQGRGCSWPPGGWGHREATRRHKASPRQRGVLPQRPWREAGEPASPDAVVRAPCPVPLSCRSPRCRQDALSPWWWQREENKMPLARAPLCSPTQTSPPRWP